MQLYAPEKLYVRTVNDANVTFTEVDMTRFVGDYTPMVTLDIMKKYEEAEKQQAYLQAYQMIIQDPTNNLMSAKQILYKKIMPALTDEEIEQIITPPAQDMAGGMGVPSGVPMNEQDLSGMTQNQPMPMQEGVNYGGQQF